MFAKNWRTSERRHGAAPPQAVRIPVSDGVDLDGDVFLPDAAGRFPAIVGLHCYDKARQTAPAIPGAMGRHNSNVEAGDPTFFARRGYAHVVVNVRGTGGSGGTYSNYGPREVLDACEVIDWVANQPWCDGAVGMFGVSYYAVAAKQVAARNPKHLKAIFAPFGYTDFYRHKFYQGGILHHARITRWARGIPNCRAESWSRRSMGEEAFRAAIAGALQDPDIRAVPDLVAALSRPEEGANPLIVDAVLNPCDGPYWQERDARLEDILVPTYLGACWGIYGLHLPGEFEAWERIGAPKRLVVGPPVYLDRPVYQYQYESLRWFDHWLRGMETGLTQDPPVRLFVMGTGKWRTAESWPLPETRWTPFYLHERELLSEHEAWPHEGVSSLQDNPFSERGSLRFLSPPLVEDTEVIGPIVLQLYASTSGEDVHWFASLWDLDDATGEEAILTRGWLKGSLRAVDPSRSKPWAYHHPFNRPEKLRPDEVYRFDINIVPTGNRFRVGHRIGLKVRCVDDDHPRTYLQALAEGHLWRQTPSWVTVYHDAEHPSCVWLPVTRGNVVGTFMSGGRMPV